MKTTVHASRALPKMLGLFLIVFCVTIPMQLSYAHNKVVVVPLAGDDAPPEPTAPLAKVNPGQTDYTIMASTVIDKITGLEWQRIDDNTIRNWNAALDYCANLSLDGRTDWRLPDIIELQSIVDYGQTSTPIIDGVAFPGTNSSGYWSASSRASSSGSAWVVNFGGGNVSSNIKSNFFYVRCVR